MPDSAIIPSPRLRRKPETYQSLFVEPNHGSWFPSAFSQSYWNSGSTKMDSPGVGIDPDVETRQWHFDQCNPAQFTAGGKISFTNGTIRNAVFNYTRILDYAFEYLDALKDYPAGETLTTAQKQAVLALIQMPDLLDKNLHPYDLRIRKKYVEDSANHRFRGADNPPEPKFRELMQRFTEPTASELGTAYRWMAYLAEGWGVFKSGANPIPPTQARPFRIYRIEDYAGLPLEEAKSPDLHGNISVHDALLNVITKANRTLIFPHNHDLLGKGKGPKDVLPLKEISEEDLQLLAQFFAQAGKALNIHAANGYIQDSWDDTGKEAAWEKWMQWQERGFAYNAVNLAFALLEKEEIRGIARDDVDFMVDWTKSILGTRSPSQGARIGDENATAEELALATKIRNRLQEEILPKYIIEGPVEKVFGERQHPDPERKRLGFNNFLPVGDVTSRPVAPATVVPVFPEHARLLEKLRRENPDHPALRDAELLEEKSMVRGAYSTDSDYPVQKHARRHFMRPGRLRKEDPNVTLGITMG